MIKEKTQVEIFGRTIELNTEGMTPIEANALAQFVSERMDELSRQNKIVDTSKLAVLTALTFADELRRLQARYDEMSQTVSQRLENIKKTLEEALKL